jgi:serine/threonine protein kinase
LADAPAVGGWSLLARAGEGTSGVVFEVARGDERGALKVARALGTALERERLTLARAQRRWGPALLDAGRLTEDVVAPGDTTLARGSAWMVTRWTDGEPLRARLAPTRAQGERARLVAIVAHGVGRGLDELHRSGVRHGDVKPANVLLATTAPSVDRARDRGATLVDLDLAADVADGNLEGGTPRYLAPELRAGEPATPAADLFALGVMLA